MKSAFRKRAFVNFIMAFKAKMLCIKAKVILFIVLGVFSTRAEATSISASSFGWNGTDDTQSLYDAFEANVDTLYIDLQAGDWVSGPLIFDNTVSNKIVIFERDVKIRALEGAYDAYLYNGLLSFTNCSKVSLIGYGATLQMNKQEYIDLDDDSEWRHIISLSGCNNFKIFGLELFNSGGDGIEISGIWQEAIPSTNIHIRDCLINNNYRQGISITSARNVLIEHCEIINTSGTPPAFGIDLEPDNAYDEMNNIEIKSCSITGNEGGGILLAFWKLNQSSNPVSVDISDCYIGSNNNEGIVADINSNGPVSGYVNFKRCIIEKQPGNGIFANKRESLTLTFTNIVIRDVGKKGGSYDVPIFIQKQFDYTGHFIGNVKFDNVYIDDQLFSRDFLIISHWGEFAGVENINGKFYVYNPNGVSYFMEPPLVNVSVAAQSTDTLPLMEIGVFTDDSTAYETGTDTTATFTVNRYASEASFPIGVYFNVAGTAVNRLDYHYFPGSIVIPANSSDTSYSIIAIEDELLESFEDINLTIRTDDHYSISDDMVQLFIGDMALGRDHPGAVVLTLYPNPANDYIAINSEFNVFGDIKIFNALGQLIEVLKPGDNKIDISALHSGIYYLQLNTSARKVMVKFIKE